MIGKYNPKQVVFKVLMYNNGTIYKVYKPPQATPRFAEITKRVAR